MKKQVFKIRLLKAILVCLIMNVIDLLACYLPILDMYKRRLVTTITFNENIITGDFHTPLNYGVVWLFVYLFFISYVMNSVKIDNIIRYQKRKEYWKMQCKRSLFATVIFAAIHEMCSAIFLLIFGKVQLLISHKWIQGIVFQLLASVTYYFLTYLLYECITTKLRQNISLIAVAVFSTIEYYCAFKLLKDVWMPVSDLALMGDLCVGFYSEMQCLAALFRLWIVAFFMAIVFFKTKNREDFLAYEKG